MKNTDERALAFVNMFAVLGSIPRLCELDENAAALADKDISIGFSVKDGPRATLTFGGGKCTLTQGCDSPDIKIPFGSPKKFNGMVDGTVTPIPCRGFFKLGFLLKNFIKITDILEKYLRPKPADMADPEFFRKSTLLTLNVLVSAAAQLGNEDEVGRASAGYIPDGNVRIAIGSDATVWLNAKNSRLTALFSDPGDITASMTFASLELASDIFAGKANSVAAVGTGGVRIYGMIPQVDNINRIFDRVSLYLQ
ncbi:MAG: hypothetical protein IJY86_03040 [Clostridia bacterium]|nr:hypothetical protein [Clostridia bacterium]